jgi:hypothetical protein
MRTGDTNYEPRHVWGLLGTSAKNRYFLFYLRKRIQFQTLKTSKVKMTILTLILKTYIFMKQRFS